MPHSNNIEREIKLSLPDAATYQRLITLLPLPHLIVTQTNLFFDTTDRELGEKHCALRLRREKSQLDIETHTLALKGSATIENGVTIRQEHELDISAELAQSIYKSGLLRRADLGPLSELLSELPSNSFDQVISFSNLRTISIVMIANISLAFEVDATTYVNGFKDYELEIELRNELASMHNLSDTILSMLGDWKVSFTPQLESKFERALNHEK